MSPTPWLTNPGVSARATVHAQLRPGMRHGEPAELGSRVSKQDVMDSHTWERKLTRPALTPDVNGKPALWPVAHDGRHTVAGTSARIRAGYFTGTTW
ncbi:hypothetical protein MOD31_12360 [Paenarthrobacter sp. TYUT067]|uniref:hypothetical protein n=1 Tax=Paenarthrobacter sp. TYUT067 TaxID=2926245 RepID=UPI00202ECF86|nr:hypothetical protein [Paenarthrobacter sp. TYUT067]MCM0616821.1 hypothetical protein [Paenarthrobacter sp. TYUT067]